MCVTRLCSWQSHTADRESLKQDYHVAGIHGVANLTIALCSDPIIYLSFGQVNPIVDG